MADEELRVETPKIVAVDDTETHTIPVVIVPGKPGPPGKDGAVIGGAVINDSVTATNSVWSSQHTHDRDEAVVDSLTPEIDLVLLFNNAMA